MNSPRRRWIAALLSFVFAFCLSEQVVPEACDGDSGRSYAITAADAPAQNPADNGPVHGGPHLCHCAHTTGAISGAAPRLGLSPELHVASGFLLPSQHSGRTLQPDSRPPIA
jgi:hypothetical protein